VLLNAHVFFLSPYPYLCLYLYVPALLVKEHNVLCLMSPLLLEARSFVRPHLSIMDKVHYTPSKCGPSLNNPLYLPNRIIFHLST
jgi:hypothetical protein